ncbi:MAG TPA: hypothetical protein VFQ91_19560 [Bryobacteraceae bacterium]|nr:hypothetical protein [Bryobacteraceae bacterium]
MLDRREFLVLAAAARAAAQSASAPAIRETHFPNRLCQFVWRNWELANLDRIAAVAGATPSQIAFLAAAMGLPPKRKLSDDQLRRIYVSVIRQNWHLLPKTQLTQLLGWTPQRLAFTLKEDDFLDVKLGPKLPCQPVRYAALTAAEASVAAGIKRAVLDVFGKELDRKGTDICGFVAELSDPGNPLIRPHAETWHLAPIDDPRLRRAGERFHRFLLESFQVRTGPGKSIVLALTPDLAGSRTTVDSAGIRIEASDMAELHQAIYAVQDRMEEAESPILPPGVTLRKTVWSPRYLYSYFALYGDPLLEPEADPFPDAYLEKLARAGINGVWLQGVLNTLAPSKQFPEFGTGAETRLRNLNELVRRAAEYGVKVYLYLNEPRALPAAFFAKRPEMRGSSHQQLYSMCTSHPAVRAWITDSLAYVFRAVPELGGVFTISMSENHTNCFSHGGAWRTAAPTAGDCPRCTRRDSWDVLAELFIAMRDGIRQGSATADVIHYDWGWPDSMVPPLLAKLPPDTRIVSISEWSLPVERGGVKNTVGEYSISVIGPGPRATRNWALASRAGMTNLAKVQFNNTWEISAVPYIPVPQLILRHCENLRRAGISGLMAAWTCGGYPSPNLNAAKAYYADPPPDFDVTLDRAARQRYGPVGAPHAIAAWERFSSAFQQFPYGVAIYIIPVQHGPANLLRLHPTGHKPGMILFPHDALKAWCGRYPPEVVQSQFAALATQWSEGLPLLEKAVAAASPGKQRNAAMDLAIARTCFHHFQSVANQVEFYRLRGDIRANRKRLREIAENEITLARAQFPIARDWSVIGYEASNHYYYTPLDLVEKVLNCRRILADLAGQGKTISGSVSAALP